MARAFDSGGSYHFALTGFVVVLALAALALLRLPRQYPFPVQHGAAPARPAGADATPLARTS